MLALLRRAGFGSPTTSTRSRSSGRLLTGAGTTVVAGAEARAVLASGFLRRLAPGDSYRETWRAGGVAEAEIDEARGALAAWAVAEDAWYVILHCDMLAWK